MSELVVEALRLHGKQLAFMTPFAGVALFVAFFKGFFSLPKPRSATEWALPTLFQFGFVVFLYIITQAIVALIGLFVVGSFFQLDSEEYLNLKVWVSLLSVIAAGFGVVLFALFAKGGAFRALWTGNQTMTYQRSAFQSGALTWFMVFPIVMFLAHFLAVAILLFWGTVPEEQVAVDFYRDTQSNVMLLIVSSLLIGLIVPVVEEVIFRMFLQSSMRRKLSAWPAIVVTSVIFSLFHYAGQQGIANVQLLITLFCLSLFIGVLYERWGSLWAPIGLHATFNTVSMLMVNFGE